MDGFRKNSAIMIFLTTSSSAINYLCQVALGHIMTLSSYGIINTIFSLILVLSVPATSINMLTAKLIAQQANPLQPQEPIVFLMKRLGVKISIGLMIFSVLFCIPGAKMLQAHPVTIIVTGVSVAVAVFPAVISGVLTGKGAFLAAGLFSLVVPFCKALGVLGAFAFSSDLAQQLVVLFSIVVGNILSIVAGRRALASSGTTPWSKIAGRISALDTSAKWIIVVNFVYLLFGNGDIFFITLFLGTEQSGIYSASMLFGRVLFFFTTALVSVLLPYVSRAASSQGVPNRVFKISIFMTTAVCLVCMIPVNLFPEWIISLVYGERYIPAVIFVPYSCLAATLVSLLNLELNYFIGIGREKRITCHMVIALLMLFVGVALFHQTVQQILVVLIAVLMGLFFLELPACWGKKI